MNLNEFEQFTELLRALFPGLRIEEKSLLIWYDVLQGLDYAKCVEFAKDRSRAGSPAPVPGEIVAAVNPLAAPPPAAQLPAYLPMGTRYEGDPHLLQRFPKLKTLDSHDRQLVEASIRYRDGIKEGRYKANRKAWGD